MTFTLTGSDELTRNLEAIARAMTPQIERGLFEEGKRVEKESRANTPVLTGAARDSHETTRPRTSGGVTRVEVKAGGPSAPHVVIIHELVEREGAKFLEKSLAEERGSMLRGLAGRIDLKKGAP